MENMEIWKIVTLFCDGNLGPHRICTEIPQLFNDKTPLTYQVFKKCTKC